MFKRANKTTALLLAAAAVISLAPATGASAAEAKRLGVKDGTVKQGIAYDGGKYSYYGFRTDEDLTGIYFNNGGDAKDTTNSDLDDYRFNTLSKYGTKYAYAHEGSNEDEYLIDLSTGKIVDDETKEEKRDKARVDLQSKIKKAERYNGTDDDKNDFGGIKDFQQILQGQFGEVWFKYTVNGEKIGTAPVVSAEKTVVGYQLPEQAEVDQKIADYQVAVIRHDTTATAPSFTVAGLGTFTYGTTVPTGEIAITSYTDIVNEAKRKLNTISADLAGVTYNKVTGTDTTTGAAGGIATTTKTTTVNTNAPVFATAAQRVGTTNYVGYVADVTGAFNDTNYPGLTNAEIGTITDAANKIGAKTLVTGTDAQDGNVYKEMYGFADENGKYIDASYYANMKVYSSTKGRAVMIDKYDELDKDAELMVHLDSIDAVSQDKDYIYAIAEVTVSGNGATQTTQHFFQKISKAQGEKENGAYTPKSTTSYLLDNGIYKEEDMQKAYDVITATGTKQEGASDRPYLLGMTVKGSDLYVTRANKENVKVYKFNLKSSYKSDVVLSNGALKTDVDTPAVLWDGKSDEDINDKFDVLSTSDVVEDKGLVGITPVLDDSNDNEQVFLYNQPLYRHPAVSIDVNGNTWSLKKNTITKFDGKDKKSDIYSVDGAMDAIDVYDDNSLIAWDTDGDRYTNIKEGTAVTEKDGINVNPDINKDKFKNGYDATEKKFYKNGTVVTNDWAADNGKWYLLDANGTALTGWQQKGGVGPWYLLGADGAMLTGWQQVGGVYYYLNPVNTSGAMLTGWFQDTTGTWYYADTNGHMLANTTIGGYTLSASGAWVQ